MRALLTGATGFVGSHLLEALISNGHSVVALKRPTSNVPDRLALKQVEWVDVDDDLTEKLTTLGEFDVVVHLATSYARQGASFLEAEKANVEFPLKLLEFSISGGCNFFVNTDTFFSREEYQYSHLMEYVITKQNFLKWGKLAVNKKSGFCFVNARLEHVYGPGDGEEKFIPSLVSSLLANNADIELTSCEQRRDFIYISDVIDAYQAIISNRDHLGGYIEVGVGSGSAVPLRDLVVLVKKITKSRCALNFGLLGQRPGEIMNSKADIDILKSLGWVPRVNMECGLKYFINAKALDV